MIDCDWCEEFFALSDLWNVDYTDGWGNVLCAKCVEASKELMGERFQDAWQSEGK